MKSENLDQILELREPLSINDNICRKPIFYYASLCFSLLAICLVTYLFAFHKGREGMAGMFDGLQYMLGAMVAMGIGFICTVVGFFRSEKANWPIRINSAVSVMFAFLMLFLMSR